MEAMPQDAELDIAVPHSKVQVAQQAPAQAAAPERVALGADGLPAPPTGSAMPAVPTHKAQMTDEDKELEEIMRMAGQA
jgi:hypothetical protein